MAFQVTMRVATGKAAEAIAKRSVNAIAKRAEMLGVQMQKETETLIDRELGPGDGKSAKRGLISMREMPFRHEVHNPGHMPLTVSLHNDVTGPSAVKFAALEFGTKKNYPIFGQGGKTHDLVGFEGTNGADAGRSVVVKSPITHPGVEGRQFMRRGSEIAVYALRARWI
jgi:hypothetical protein